MKKMINNPDNIVDEMIDGYIAAFPNYVKRHEKNPRIVLRTIPKPKDKVSIMIGNGSGHEPIAIGWVGEGMLDANAVGEIFAAPSPALIQEAIEAIDSDAGVLLLISSHSGDLINSKSAVLNARMAGVNVDMLVMYDDISSAPKEERQNRRGGPGTTFIYKILGAYAEQGASLSELKHLGETIRDNTCTLGASLKSGISPLTGKEMFTLPENKIFIGMGVHGEPGLAELEMTTCDEIVTFMMEKLIADLPYQKNDQVLVMLNNMGSSTLMEQLIIYRKIDKLLKEAEITALPPLIGTFVTTQETVGFTISLCKVDQQMEKLWNAPFDVPFFNKA